MSATTSDTERFCRLFCLVVQTGTKVLRKHFVLHVERQNCTVQQFFANNKRSIGTLYLFPDQRSLIYPADKSDADLKKFDITLLALLFKHLLRPVDPTLQQLILDLKKIRNGLIAHKGEPIINQNEFRRIWQDTSNILCVLANMSNDKNFEDEITSEIASFQNGPLSLQETIRVIKDTFNHDVKLDLQLSRIYEEQTEQTKRIKVLEDMIKKLEDNKKNKFDSEEEDEVDSSVSESGTNLQIMNNLKEHTRIRVQSALKDKPVLTRQIEKAEQVIANKRVVTITGNPGEGKTFASYLLLNKVTSSKLDRCIILHDAKDWSYVDIAQVDVLFIDDIFGKHKLDEGLLITWSSVLSDLHSYVTEGKVMLIIALRQAVLAEFNSRHFMFSWLPLLNNKVELSSMQLSQGEKSNILNTALDKYGRDRKCLDVDQCVQNFTCPIGFPYCCNLFASDEGCFYRREDFFLKPYRGIMDILNNMDQCKIIMLAYIFCCSNFHVVDQTCELQHSSKNLLQQLCEAFRYDKHVQLYEKMHEVLEELDGLYIVQEKGTYRIAHNILYESVGLELSERVPKLVVDKCNIDFLCQCVQTSINQTGESFVERNRLYKDLCLRFIEEVIQQNNAVRISVHPALNEPDIMKTLIQILKETRKTVQFLRGGGNDPTTSIIAYFAVKNIRPNAFVKHLLDPLNSWRHTLSFWKYPLIKSGLWLAYAAGNRDLVDVLLPLGTKSDVSFLYASIFSRDSVLVESVLKNLKDEGRLDIHCLSLSLELACVIGCPDILNVILKWNPKLNAHHVIAATFSGNDDLIQIIAYQLRTKEGWDRLGIEILESFGRLLKATSEGHNAVMISVENFLRYQKARAFTRYSEIFSMAECMYRILLENGDKRTFIDYVESMQKTGWLKVLLEQTDFVYRSFPSLVLRYPDIYIKDLVCFLKCMKQWNPNGDAVILASEGVITSGREEMFQILVDSGMTVNERHYLLACRTDREGIISCVTRNLPSTEV